MLEVTDARKKASEELMDLFDKSATIELSEDIVWTIRGADRLNTEAKDLITGAEREV